jgi:hypothetical protein
MTALDREPVNADLVLLEVSSVESVPALASEAVGTGGFCAIPVHLARLLLQPDFSVQSKHFCKKLSFAHSLEQFFFPHSTVSPKHVAHSEDKTGYFPWRHLATRSLLPRYWIAHDLMFHEKSLLSTHALDISSVH